MTGRASTACAAIDNQQALPFDHSDVVAALWLSDGLVLILIVELIENIAEPPSTDDDGQGQYMRQTVGVKAWVLAHTHTAVQAGLHSWSRNTTCNNNNTVCTHATMLTSRGQRERERENTATPLNP